MRRLDRILLGLALVALLAGGSLVANLAAPAEAATTTVTTDDMQYARQASPGATDCGTWSLVNGTANAVKRTFVSFNTNGVVPAGNDVTGVTLRLYPRANYGGNVTVKTYPRDHSACDITWNNQAASGAQVGASTGGFVKNVYKSITLDATSVNLTGRTGYAINTTATSDLQFMTDGGANPAKLDITYAPTATTTTTTTTTTTLPPPTTCGVVTAAPEYGAGSTGPGNETRETVGTQATTSNYTTVLAAAQPGDKVLLRAGTTYGNLSVPSGVTVKPYDCETVQATSLSMASGTATTPTTVAGITVQSTTAQWLLRLNGGATALHDFVVRNANLNGGTTEAIRVNDDVNGVLLTGLRVNGGQNNHAIKILDESVGFAGPHPRNVTITNSFIEKTFFGASHGEDGIQLEGTTSPVELSHLSFGLVGEEFIDVKTPSTGVTINNNLLDSNVGGVDLTPTGGCTLLTTDMVLSFQHNKLLDSSCTLEVGGYTDVPNTDPTITDNVIADTEVLIRQSNGVHFTNNDQTRGIFALGTSNNPGDVPSNLTITGNTFHGPATLKVNAGSTYTCDGNTWDTSAGGFAQEGTLTCTNQPVP